MTYDMVKFERGQVWMIRHKYQNPAVGHEILKDRPWLILSIGKFNKSSGLLTAVPLTTRDKVVSPAQVIFNTERGHNNVILCEQIRTFDHTSGAYIFDFLGNLSPEVLERVDVAVSIHLGMHYSPITLKKLYDSMEAIIKSVGYMQQKADTPKFTDEDVNQFAEKLKMLAADTLESEVVTEESPKFDAWGVPTRETIIAETQEASKVDAWRGKNFTAAAIAETQVSATVEDTTEHQVEDTEPKEETNSAETKQKRIKWTPETCEEFLRDADTLPMKQVMNKWNILKKARFYSMKKYAADLMKKTV